LQRGSERETTWMDTQYTFVKMMVRVVMMLVIVNGAGYDDFTH